MNNKTLVYASVLITAMISAAASITYLRGAAVISNDEAVMILGALSSIFSLIVIIFACIASCAKDLPSKRYAEKFNACDHKLEK